MRHLEKLPRLKLVDLFRTKVSNDGVASLGRIQSLQDLDLRDTQVTDEGLVHLNKLPRLGT